MITVKQGGRRDTGGTNGPVMEEKGEVVVMVTQGDGNDDEDE